MLSIRLHPSRFAFRRRHAGHSELTRSDAHSALSPDS